MWTTSRLTYDLVGEERAAPTTEVAEPRAGVFFSVTSQDGDRLVSISAPGTAPLVRIAGGAVNLPAGTLVDLTGPEPKVVLTGLSSPLMAGSTITMNFNFARVGTITMQVPVEPQAYEYATYSPPVIAAAGQARGSRAAPARVIATPSATP